MKHALFAILVLLASQAQAQVYRLYCVGQRACYGSAVSIGDKDGKSIFVTAGHNVQGMNRYFLDLPQGRVESQLIAKSQKHDLAALAVRTGRKLPIYRPSPLDRTSGEYVLTGYGEGRNRMQPRQARISKGQWTTSTNIGVQTYDLRFSGAAIQGESGGALVSSDGRLVGIVSATSRTDGYATGYEAVCEMFAGIGWRVCPPQYGPPATLPPPYQDTEPPYVPEERPVPQPTPEPRIEYRQGPRGERGPQGPPGESWNRQIVRGMIREEITEQISKVPAIPGPRGAQGPPGEIGPRGPPGQSYDPAELQALKQQITEQQVEIDSLRRRKLTFEILDEKNNVVDRQDYRIDEPIKLRLIPE